MATDPKIREAIEVAVEEEGQPRSLAPLIIAWFDAVASGNEQLDTHEDHRHLDLLFAKTECESPDSTSAPDDFDDRRERTENDQQ